MLKNSFFAIQTFKAPLICKIKDNAVWHIQVAGIKYYPPPPELSDPSTWPESRKPPQIPRQPDYGSIKPPKMTKMLRLIRGSEEIHTDLIYKGYGIKALLGGRLKYNHFEKMRALLNKRVDKNRAFVFWRVEAPWQPVSKRGPGRRMGGGKSSIHHYVTPVKANRIIVEIGGNMHELEAKWVLCGLAEVLPFPARFVSQKLLDQERENEIWVKKNNKNPYTMEYVIKNNMGGCQNWLSPYDYKWFGKYR